MKIVTFGLSITSSWGNRHADTWRGLSRSLAQRGHRIVFFERDLSVFSAHRDLSHWNDGELRRFATWDAIRFRAKQDLADADVAIITSACPDAEAALNLTRESPVPLRVFHDLDSAATLDYEESELPVDYKPPRSLELFDLVLSSTGGRALEELRSMLRAPRVAALYPGVDPSLYVNTPFVQKRNRFTGLSYLADCVSDDAAALERLFLEPAQRLPFRQFRLGGRALQSDVRSTSNLVYEHVASATARTLFNLSSRLLLNLAGRANQRMGFCPSDLLFQAAACGTPILTENWDGLHLFFEPDSEILVATTADEAVEATELLDGHLAQIAGQARERVFDEHTYAHRAIHLETLIENTANAAEEDRLLDVRNDGVLEDASM